MTVLGHDRVLIVDGQVIAWNFVLMHNQTSYTELEEQETNGETPHACLRVLWIWEGDVELGEIPAANKGACNAVDIDRKIIDTWKNNQRKKGLKNHSRLDRTRY